MNQTSIFIPFFGLMLLTILVWLYMYHQRLSFIFRNRVNAQSLATTRNVEKVIPSSVNTPAENLANLFELPVLFYATCLYLYVTQQVDDIYVLMAYVFLLFRIGHSVVHCSYNRVIHRFVLHILSSFVLWVIILRAFIGAVNA